ncbi:MAG: hypothetical protein V2A73_04215 [Pseudomonadota bacterium]
MTPYNACSAEPLPATLFVEEGRLRHRQRWLRGASCVIAALRVAGGGCIGPAPLRAIIRHHVDGKNEASMAMSATSESQSSLGSIEAGELWTANGFARNPRRLILFLVMLSACGPKASPLGPAEVFDSKGASRFEARKQDAGGPRQVLVGEMCLGGAQGRPATAVLLARRSLSWTADPADLRALIARGGATTFAVFSGTGQRSGVFTVAGPVDAGLDTDAVVALGSYAGGLPCGEGEGIAECAVTRPGCGLAVAELGAGPVPLETGESCIAGDTLVVDVDRDGAKEQFPLNAFLDELRAPAEEVVSIGTTAPSCSSPRFSVPSIVPGADPRDWRGLDVVGIADLDGNGRLELILQYRYGDKRTWAVFGATQTPARLVLLTEAELLQ